MKKTAKMTAIAAVALMSGALAVNCNNSKQSGGATGNDGMVSLALTLPSSVTISQVAYKIHSAQATNPPADKSGTIDVSNAMAMASIETSYPASTADTITLTATTSNGEPCTGTSMSFSIFSGQASTTGVTLTCGLLSPDSGVGSIVVNGMVVDNTDICPLLDSYSASPLTTGPTGTINLAAHATDGDVPADGLTYAWTVVPAAVGAFSAPTAGTTNFVCPGTGNFAITVTVDDHHMPTNCTAGHTFNVACGLCGNGHVDPGEDCDDAASFSNNTCDPNTCKFIPVACGNGLVQPTGGETCDSTAAFAAHTCAPPGGLTVDNVPGPGTHVIPQCTAVPAVCGDGVKEGSEQCDDGPAGSSTCTTGCTAISPCLICETTGAACLGTTIGANPAFGCSALSGAAQTNCIALRTCLDQHPNCSNPTNMSPPNTDPTACFCGSLSAAACQGAASATIMGPCASAYFAVYGGVTDPNRDAILGDFFSKTTATGMANNVYACDVTKSCLSICP